MIYKSGDHNELYQKVKFLLENAGERKKLGKAAYETLTETWNADTAAARFLELVEAIKQGKESPFAEGPCSED